jgi:DNA-binding LytR/AlgR family response regulator
MKFYICDDSQIQLELYEYKLHILAQKYGVNLGIKLFDSGEKMLFNLEDEMESVSAIYLDINMPGMDGVEVGKRLNEMNYEGEIIFLTVSKDHFIPAFDLGAFNYIVKHETTEERFELVFLRVLTIAREKEKEYIVLLGGGEHRKIDISQIHYFEVQKRIVTVYYGYGEKFSFPSTIGKVENNLYGKGFLRVHRGFLVNRNAVERFTYEEIQLADGKSIPIGRTYQTEVSREMKGISGAILH